MSHTHTRTETAGRTEADAVAEVAFEAAQIHLLASSQQVPGLPAGVLVFDAGPGRRVLVEDLGQHLPRPRAATGHRAALPWT